MNKKCDAFARRSLSDAVMTFMKNWVSAGLKMENRPSLNNCRIPKKKLFIYGQQIDFNFIKRTFLLIKRYYGAINKTFLNVINVVDTT